MLSDKLQLTYPDSTKCPQDHPKYIQDILGNLQDVLNFCIYIFI